jgi:hypothetical protein
MELFAAFELVAYAAAFWLFLVSPSFRRERVRAFAAAGAGGRAAMLVEGAVAAFCGLLPAAAVAAVL